jgi:hypothetical protein
MHHFIRILLALDIIIQFLFGCTSHHFLNNHIEILVSLEAASRRNGFTTRGTIFHSKANALVNALSTKSMQTNHHQGRILEKPQANRAAKVFIQRFQGTSDSPILIDQLAGLSMDFPESQLVISCGFLPLGGCVHIVLF